MARRGRDRLGPDRRASSFESAVYNPGKGTCKVIRTPADFFRAGEVQPPNGKVLILGGNKAYPAANGRVGYEGLNTSYLFKTATSRYQRISIYSPPYLFHGPRPKITSLAHTYWTYGSAQRPTPS